ncbi:ThiF family adenylyltransferase [Arthrobacter sp. E3]|uniref:ThiF family adenylyltransferase n=1 Tax=Arthrobacter sp. E3 TaxID=517402 RepID=UPI001A945930|nr:ThiF family adenylyltransferase [Arthrobacter sp. E3]
MTTINPGLRMVRRGPHGVQIGVGAGGLILEGLLDSEMTFVQALRHGISDAQVLTQAVSLGVAELRAQEICAMLAGLLFSDAELRTQGFRAERLLPERSALLGLHQGPCQSLMERREHGVIHLIGLGRTGAALAAVLVSAGVGTILLEDDCPVTATDVGPTSFNLSDIGLSRSVAVRRHLLRIDPGCQAHIVHDGGAGGPSAQCLDLAVVVGHDAVPAPTTARFMSAERPHLLVLLREQDGTVGPLVVPGVTACAECVERHRSVHDPLWLEVCTQLAAIPEPSADRRPRAESLENAALSTTLAGTAAAQVLLFLDAINQPSSWSSVMTFHPDNGRWTQQDFRIHPDCGCQWQNQPLATISSTDSP